MMLDTTAVTAIDAVLNVSEEAERMTQFLQDVWSFIPPAFSLDRAVAVNPLLGWSHLDFEQAMALGAGYFERADALSKQLDHLSSWNALTIQLAQAYYSQHEVAWGMPGRHRDFYGAVAHMRRMSDADRMMHPRVALAQMLDALCLSPSQQKRCLRAMLMTLPGWAGYVRGLKGVPAIDRLSLEEEAFLAVRLRLALDTHVDIKALIHSSAVMPQTLPLQQRMGEITKAESDYASWLSHAMQMPSEGLSNDGDALDVQFVFCMDVRSEPMRRALESQGARTAGVAGFFAAALHVSDRSGIASKQCPVILAPTCHVHESAGTFKTSLSQRPRLQRWLGDFCGVLRDAMKEMKLMTKTTVVTPFVLVEWLGLWDLITTVLRIGFDKHLRSKQYHHALSALKGYHAYDLSAWPLEARVDSAEGFLKSAGLTAQSWPAFVVLCGHGSVSANNPQASLLQCGACGGQSGAHNAVLMCCVLNDPTVRKALGQRGLVVPDQTHFIPTLHETTTQQWVMLDAVGASETDLMAERGHGWSQVATAMISAAESVQRRHTQRLKVSQAKQSDAALARRATQWSEARPEWGLAEHGCLWIAPRAMTAGMDLAGTAFLHEYHVQFDPDGSLLRQILEGPMVVAHWINMQYLMASLQPNVYGAGSKMNQNVTGGMGLMLGNGSDLMHGPSWQSVAWSRECRYHQPKRLRVYIAAPEAFVRRVMAASPQVHALFTGAWIHVMTLGEGGAWSHIPHTSTAELSMIDH